MRILPQVSHMLENRVFFTQLCQFTMFDLSHQCQKCQNFKYLNSMLKFFGKKYRQFINFSICLALIPIRIRPDSNPDPQHCLHPVETAMVFIKYLHIGFLSLLCKPGVIIKYTVLHLSSSCDIHRYVFQFSYEVYKAGILSINQSVAPAINTLLFTLRLPVAHVNTIVCMVYLFAGTESSPGYTEGAAG